MSLLIISFILMTCLFDQAVLFLGEIGCRSLLGPKGLKATAGQSLSFMLCSCQYFLNDFSKNQMVFTMFPHGIISRVGFKGPLTGTKVCTQGN